MDLNSTNATSHNDKLSISSQKGFMLTGTCQIESSYPSVLIAMLGNQVVGLSMLSSSGFSQSADKVKDVRFTLELEMQTIIEHVDEHVSFVLVNHFHKDLTRISCADLILNSVGGYEEILKRAPSYGFIGGGKYEPLTLEVNKAVKSLKMTIAQEKAFFNIRDLCIVGGNGQRIAIDHNVSLNCSSSHNDDLTSTNVMQAKGFHSKLEDYPWLRIEFEEPQFITRIEICNRADAYGKRTRNLEVEIEDVDQQTSQLYSSSSKKSYARFYSRIMQYGGAEILFNCSAEDFREKFLVKLIDLLSHKEDDGGNSLPHFALNFLSIWAEEAPSASLHKLEIEVLALYTYHMTKSKLGFVLVPFSKILSTRRDLDLYELLVNKHRVTNNRKEIQLTKHGISHKGILNQNIPKALRTISIVINDFEAMGFRPCIAYGTLLGARRDQAFIAHDDDVDILIEYPQDNLDHQQVFALTEKLLQELDPEKYRTDLEQRSGTNLNMHILVRETNMVIDIFPYWNAQGKSFLHMEKMKVRGIPENILADRKMLKLYDTEFPAPIETEAFLLERYGEGWSISDKYHEWPWQLKD
ncbi:MAG: LicD family protein [Alteromonadaceae bacterium]|nr:LicD family protein [Alteromonadaceae bacterium]